MALLLAGCAAAAAALLLPRGRRRTALTTAAAGPGPRLGAAIDGADSPWLRASVCVGACACAGWVLSGVLGLGLGVVAGVLVAVWVGRLEPASVVREREQVERDLPLTLELMAACSAVGCAPSELLPMVSRAVGGPLGSRLESLAARLALGADPVQEWTRLTRDAQLAGLAAAMGRSFESGAPLADGLVRLAQDRRRERRAQVQRRARRVGVRAAGPLALCFLPAFMFVGVVPTVAGSFSHLFG